MSKVKNKPTLSPETGMSVTDAIYTRRATRSYLPKQIDKEAVHTLLAAAVQAPTAMHEEPWAFAVIQDKDILKRLSDTAKALVIKEAHGDHSKLAGHATHLVGSADFNVFYDAGTLIVIYGKHMGPFVVADCWLAAENLMLAACSMGLGTCVIGFAVGALNSSAWKAELGIPAEMTAYAPIIVGVPSGVTPPVPRKEPEIVTWKECR